MNSQKKTLIIVFSVAAVLALLWFAVLILRGMLGGLRH